MVRGTVSSHRRRRWWVRALVRSQHHAAHHHAGLSMIHRLVTSGRQLLPSADSVPTDRNGDAVDNIVRGGLFVRVVLAVRALAIQPAVQAALEAFAVPLRCVGRNESKRQARLETS